MDQTQQPGVDPRFLPMSLLKQMQGGRAPMPPAMTPKHQPAAMPRLLGPMLNQPKPGYTDPSALAAGAGTLGVAGYQSYKGMQPKEGLVEDPAAYEARKSAMLGNMASAAGAVGGNLIPGWGGKIANIAGLMAGQYAKNQAETSKGKQLMNVLGVQDPQARATAAMQLYASGE